MCREQYSAERMALAVLGGDSLETLEAWVKELFSHVPSGKGAIPSFEHLERPYEVKSWSVCKIGKPCEQKDLFIKKKAM